MSNKLASEQQKLNDINIRATEDRKKYIDETAYGTQQVAIDGNFRAGTLKITDKLSKQAVLAIQERIDGTKSFTQNRIDQIDRDYKRYEMTAKDEDAESEAPYPETRIACDDTIDDLYLIFETIQDNLNLSDNRDDLKHMFSRTLDVAPDEGTPKQNVFASIVTAIKQMPVVAAADQDVDTGKNLFIDMLSKTYKIFNKQSDVYFFNRKDIIKDMMKKEFLESGYNKVDKDGMNTLLKWLSHGVIGGEFCFKETMATKRDFILTRNADDKEGDDPTSGKYQYELNDELQYRFTPVDTRNLIYAENNREWVIEKMAPVKFSKLLNETIDAEGELRRFPLYDLDSLMKIKEVIKTTTPKKEASRESDSSNTETIDSDGLSQIEAMVDIMVCSAIPLFIDGKAYLCLIEVLKFGEALYPIRIQKFPYYELNYNFNYFHETKLGVPGILYELQKNIDTLYQFTIDMLNMALWGMMAVDEDAVVNPEELNNLQPKRAIKFKNLEGRKVEDVIKWYQPPVEILSHIMPFLDLTLETMKRLSRKGPAGEKISPNPTATEFATMTQERQKSIARLASQLGVSIDKMFKNIYIYSMLNRENTFPVRTISKRLNAPDAIETMQGINKQLYNEVSKVIDVTVDDIFVDGLEFKVNTIDNAQKQAVEKQQSMQLLNTLLPLSVDANGQPIVYTDDSDSPVILDQYSLINNVATTMGFPEVWKRQSVTPNVPAITLGTGNLGEQGTPAPASAGGPNVPPLSATPEESRVLGGVFQ